MQMVAQPVLEPGDVVMVRGSQSLWVVAAPIWCTTHQHWVGILALPEVPETPGFFAGEAKQHRLEDVEYLVTASRRLNPKP